jgi:hypothetical protein
MTDLTYDNGMRAARTLMWRQLQRRSTFMRWILRRLVEDVERDINRQIGEDYPISIHDGKDLR